MRFSKEPGTARSALSGSGVSAKVSGGTTYTKAGYGVAGLVGAGTSASVFAETGYGTVGAVASGTSASVFAKSGAGIAGLVGVGADAHFQETGAGISGLVGCRRGCILCDGGRVWHGRDFRVRGCDQDWLQCLRQVWLRGRGPGRRWRGCVHGGRVGIRDRWGCRSRGEFRAYEKTGYGNCGGPLVGDLLINDVDSLLINDSGDVLLTGDGQGLIGSGVSESITQESAAGIAGLVGSVHAQSVP